MHLTAAPIEVPFAQPRSMARAASADTAATGQRIAERLRLIEAHLAPKRRIVHAGDVIYRAGDTFSDLYLLNSGLFKLLSVSAEGREQVVGLKFRGDWMGFGAIAKGAYACDAVAMDTAEVWTVPYDELLRACAAHPALMTIVHEAMSSEIARDRDALTAMSTLPADARVVAFLHDWAAALADRGLRADQFSLRLTRAEIGNYLGLTLETVSRVLSKLVRERLITFNARSRRDVCIPDFHALALFVQRRAAKDLH
jgi:CRP/FNR family transcriptional regulator, anaerobic regulatory protein